MLIITPFKTEDNSGLLWIMMDAVLSDGIEV